jgi:hypothetical protein
VAGTLAGACEAALWVTPCERLKTLRQAQIGMDKGARKHGSWMQSGASILKEEGVRGLFRGLGPTVMRNSSTVGVRFVLYDQAVTALRAQNGGNKQGWHALVSGAGVGALTTIINNPIDVIKSRLQVGGGGTGARMYSGTWDCVRSLLREEGPRALMQGFLFFPLSFLLSSSRLHCEFSILSCSLSSSPLCSRVLFSPLFSVILVWRQGPLKSASDKPSSSARTNRPSIFCAARACEEGGTWYSTIIAK